MWSLTVHGIAHGITVVIRSVGKKSMSADDVTYIWKMDAQVALKWPSEGNSCPKSKVSILQYRNLSSYLSVKFCCHVKYNSRKCKWFKINYF